MRAVDGINGVAFPRERKLWMKPDETEGFKNPFCWHQVESRNRPKGQMARFHCYVKKGCINFWATSAPNVQSCPHLSIRAMVPDKECSCKLRGSSIVSDYLGQCYIANACRSLLSTMKTMRDYTTGPLTNEKLSPFPPLLSTKGRSCRDITEARKSDVSWVGF